MINFKCPKCGGVLEAPKSLIGEKLDCPKCKSSCTIPRINNNTKRNLIAVFALALILIVVCIFIKQNNNQSTAKPAMSKSNPVEPSPSQSDILYMNRIQIIDFLHKKGFKAKEGWEYTTDMTKFETKNNAVLVIAWKEDSGNHQIKDILVGNMHEEDSLKNAQPVLEIWRQIKPDLVDLFIELRKAVNPYGAGQKLSYKYGPYMYGWAPNNKYYLELSD